MALANNHPITYKCCDYHMGLKTRSERRNLRRKQVQNEIIGPRHLAEEYARHEVKVEAKRAKDLEACVQIAAMRGYAIDDVYELFGISPGEAAGEADDFLRGELGLELPEDVAPVAKKPTLYADESPLRAKELQAGLLKFDQTSYGCQPGAIVAKNYSISILANPDTSKPVHLVSGFLVREQVKGLRGYAAFIQAVNQRVDSASVKEFERYIYNIKLQHKRDLEFNASRIKGEKASPAEIAEAIETSTKKKQATAQQSASASSSN